MTPTVGMKTYVQKSIAEVAKAFVRPESYTLDIDRLLLGREAALRTHTVPGSSIALKLPRLRGFAEISKSGREGKEMVAVLTNGGGTGILRLGRQGHREL
jgi:hypothetical protein